MEEPLALEDKGKEKKVLGAKMELSDEERQQLDELGISFDDEEVFLSGRDRTAVKGLEDLSNHL